MAVIVTIKDNVTGEIKKKFSGDARELLASDPERWTFGEITKESTMQEVAAAKAAEAAPANPIEPTKPDPIQGTRGGGAQEPAKPKGDGNSAPAPGDSSGK